MRRRFLAWLLSLGVCVVCAQALHAQTAGNNNPDYDRQLYFFVSHGKVSGVEVGPAIKVAPYNAWQIGAAAEWFKFKGLAVGFELAKTPSKIRSEPVTYTYRRFDGTEETTTTTAQAARGWGSFNLSYHFKGVSPRGKVVPFVTAGAGIFVRSEPTETVNYGGGLQFWQSRHVGWRVEYRKFLIEEGTFGSRLRSVRVGLVLR
jgi:hypothetical protein